MDNLLAFTAFIAGLSAANERAVEIIKKSIPWLDIKNTAPAGTPLPAADITAVIIGKDRKRELVVYLVTLASAFLIVWAASDVVGKNTNVPATAVATAAVGKDTSVPSTNGTNAVTTKKDTSATAVSKIDIPIVKDLLTHQITWGWLLLALMISAGSKVWNPILEYLKAVKDGVKGKG